MLPYQDARRTPEERTEDLLSRMTVEEKIGQLVKMDGFRSYSRQGDEFCFTERFAKFSEKWIPGTMSVLLRADWWTQINWDNGIPPEKMREAVQKFQKFVYENSRLHIPLYIMEEASHGLMALGSTVFPTGIGLGAMWDCSMMKKIGHVVGKECASAGVQATHGPVLDVIRDIRWSRCEENYAEDPELTALYVEAYLSGLQAEGIVPTLKHFCGHGSPEGGHNHGPAHAGPVELYNCQLRPFRRGIAAGARSLMSSYNAVDGEAVTGSYYYLTEVLRQQMGFDGFVVSDRGAIPRLTYQRICRTYTEASAIALKAGCDVDNGGWEKQAESLTDALKQGLITEHDLDIAAGRVLKLKFQLGLFENPCPGSDPVKILRSEEHRKIALEASRKCLTLLKNDGILPLRNVRKIAVIGPNADNVMNQLGDYTAPQLAGSISTVLSGISEIARRENVEILYAQGCSIRKNDRSGFEEALQIAEKADVILFVPGGSSTKYGSGTKRTATGAAVAEILSPEESEKESGEGTDRATLNFSGVQLDLFRELCRTETPVVTVPILGRPLIMTELLERSAAVLLAWYPGEAGGIAIAETLFGKYNPAGRLPVSLPRSEGQLPLYYNALEKRPDYVDLTSAPLLPFGYGLSYTSFSYSGLAWDGKTLSVEVSNTGNSDGEEVVQFYLTAMKAPVQRPHLELAGFCRVFIPAGEKRRVECVPSPDSVGYYDRHGIFHAPEGEILFHAGGNSQDLISVTVSF